MSAPPSGLPGRVIVCSGPRAAEEALLAELASALAATGEPPPLPVRILVPSSSLRAHMLAAVVRCWRRPLLGVQCQTLHAAAIEINERCGEPAAASGMLFALLARRAAARERQLAAPLADLRDGYAAVAATARDLADAGFRPALLEAVDEALSAAGRRTEAARARAVLRATAAAQLELERLGVGAPWTILERAAELVRHDPGAALPARAVLVHGFADATGAASDLLAALADRCAATVVLDAPPDPADPSRSDPGVVFTRRLLDRLRLAARIESRVPEERRVPGSAPATPAAHTAASGGQVTPAGGGIAAGAAPAAPATALDLFRALGERAEVREVARRIRVLLDAGTAAEEIGIVARDIAPYRSFLADQLERLAIPFSAPYEAGALEPEGRRAAALLDLVRSGARTGIDRWLDALERPLAGLDLDDLRLALAALGARRLEDLRRITGDPLLARSAFALPVRLGFSVDDDGEHDGRPRADRRTVAGAALRAAVAAGAELAESLGAWPRNALAARRVEALADLAGRRLGWSADPAGRLAAAVERVLGGCPSGFLVSDDEIALAAAEAVADFGRSPLGGAGAGVQLLGVVAARGRTFMHLFLLGANRGRFPRAIREDALLPDTQRDALAAGGTGVLADLAPKGRGADEERYLFAQLLAAAPRVTVSWLEIDEDDQRLAPSPLVERLRVAGGLADPPLVAPIFARLPAASEPAGAGGERRAPLAPVTAFEAAILAGLEGDRAGLARALPIALAEAPAPPGLLPVAAERVSAARLAALDELDPRRGTPHGESARHRLGPFFGLVGPPRASADPRHGPISVTTLEQFAGCPWQAFLERLLRVEEAPSPLAELPGLEPFLVGNVVHAALEGIVRRVLPAEVTSLDAATGAETVAVPWPAPAELDRLLRAAAAEVLAASGLRFRGLDEVLAEVARRHLDAAFRIDWAGGAGSPGALAVEITAVARLAGEGGSERLVHCRADRLDRTATGLALTDYKTGRPPLEASDPLARRAELLTKLAQGRALQVTAYAAALEPHGGGIGRYLLLRPSLEQKGVPREIAVSAGDVAALDTFRATARVLLAAWDAGVFFPRLTDAKGEKEPRRCDWCRVKEACLRGDSGARGRLVEWALQPAGEEPASATEAALLALWRLEAAPPAGAAGRDAP